MKYIRKTKDTFIIQYHSDSYGWEDCSEYSQPDYENPRSSCKADLKEYRLSNTGSYRMITRRERIQ